jgi:hypothetical protein
MSTRILRRAAAPLAASGLCCLVVTGPAQAQAPRVIQCGSSSGQQAECKTKGRAIKVRVLRNLGRKRCRQGKNWGHTDWFIWANKGCRAEFEVTYAGMTPAPPPRPTPAPKPETRLIACGNSAGAEMTCNPSGTIARVSVLRDQSGGNCKGAGNWGHDRSSIWVKRGCFGMFAVTYEAAPRPR